MTFWRPRILIIGVALICAIIAVQRHFAAVIAMQNNMVLQAKVLTAFEESHTGMLSVDVDANVISQANEAACDLFGYKKGELAGQDVTAILPAAYRPGHAEKMKAAMEAAKGGRSHVSTIRCLALRKDGTIADVYVRTFVTKTGVVALVSLASETVFSDMVAPDGLKAAKPSAP